MKTFMQPTLTGVLAMLLSQPASAAVEAPVRSFWMLDLNDQITSVVAMVGVTVFGVYNGLKEARRSNRLRQAAVAKEVLRELFTDPLGHSAMQMLDWSGRTFQAGPVSLTVAWNELKPALVVHSGTTSFDVKQQFIRDCFENLFDHLLMLEHLISIENIHYDDVRVPIQYYAAKLAKHRPTFDPFMFKYGYAKAHRLIHRLARDYQTQVSTDVVDDQCSEPRRRGQRSSTDR